MQYGSESCCSKESSGEILFKTSTSERVKMSKESFLELLGRSVSVYSPLAKMILFTS